MKPVVSVLFLFLALSPLPAEPLHSLTWGFQIDLPEGYVLTEGNGNDRYSFEGPGALQFDIRVYDGQYAGIREMAEDVNLRLKNSGDTDFFVYGNKNAAIMELLLGEYTGWGLCVELGPAVGPAVGRPTGMLLALSYTSQQNADSNLFHISALDSVIPSDRERYYPGPVTEFAFPRGEVTETALAVPGLKARIREGDAETAQALVEREFTLLTRYLNADNWQEAWIRYYRAIYRDSWDRVEDAVSQLKQSWTREASSREADKRSFAERALAFVQGFSYERDISGSDFVNIVSAVTDGRGDCDSRAVLWAIILAREGIPAAIMISRNYSHSMGLADIDGPGARFEAGGIKWLVAETTDSVDIGLIGQNVSDPAHWFAVTFQ
jgi:hypothetical protein